MIEVIIMWFIGVLEKSYRKLYFEMIKLIKVKVIVVNIGKMFFMKILRIIKE